MGEANFLQVLTEDCLLIDGVPVRAQAATAAASAK